MCGRYGFTNANIEAVKKRFNLKDIPFSVVPRFNISPGQDVPVILNTDKDKLTLARWGLIPSWTKDENSALKLINARAETILEKPMFKGLIKKKRCLIPADCFFEWKQEGKAKQPYCVRLKSKEMFSFAGLWDCWRGELISCSIITCEANDFMRPIHDRMPVILSEKEEGEWLAGEGGILPEAIDAKLMEAYRVSQLVNNPKNDSAEVLNEIK